MSTEAINNLQNEKNPKDDPNFVKFITNFGVMTGVVIGFVVLGAIGLYMAKVAESGILPTDANFKPYTCELPNPPLPAPDFIKMNIVREFGMKGMAVLLGYKAINAYSQLAKFDAKAMEKGFKSSLIKSLYEATQNPDPTNKEWKPTNLALWRSDVLNQMVASSFGFIQATFKGLSQMPEWLAMLIFGLIGLIFIPFFIIYNIGVSFWCHFKSLANVGFSLTKGFEFLEAKTREENGEKNFDKPNYIMRMMGIEKERTPEEIEHIKKEVTIGSRIVSWILWIFATLGLSIYFLGSMLVFSPMYLTFYTMFKTILARYKLKIEDDFSPQGGGVSGLKSIITFIKDTFSYKRTYIIFLSIVNLFMSANTYLGTNYFVGVIIAVILAIVYCNILVSKKPDGDNTLIKIVRKNGVGGDDDEDSEPEEEEEDDCENEGDQIQVYKDKIGEYSTKVYKSQTEAIKTIKISYDFVNNVKNKLGGSAPITNDSTATTTATAKGVVQDNDLITSFEKPTGPVDVLTPEQKVELEAYKKKLQNEVNDENVIILGSQFKTKDEIEKQRILKEHDAKIKTITIISAILLAGVVTAGFLIPGVPQAMSGIFSGSINSSDNSGPKRGGSKQSDTKQSDTKQRGGAPGDINELKQLPGFELLNTDMNTLIKQYFKGSDFGRQSLILSVTDDANVTMQKLRSQLKYLLSYSTELDVNVKKAIESLTKFKTFLDTQTSKTNLNGIAIPKMPSETDASIPFIKLMVSLRQSERLIYNIRPNIVEIVKGTNNVDSLSADAPAQQKTSMFSMGSSSANKKYNLKYFEVVIPLENTIKQIDSVIFEDTDNIFIDLIVDRNDPNNEKYKPTIELFNKKINEQYKNVSDDIVFTKFIKERIVEQPAEIASSSTSSTSSSTSIVPPENANITSNPGDVANGPPNATLTQNLTSGISNKQAELTSDLTDKQDALAKSMADQKAELTSGLTNKQAELTSGLTSKFADKQAALTKGLADKQAALTGTATQKLAEQQASLTSAANANVSNALTSANALNKPLGGGGRTRRKQSHDNKKQEYNIRLV
jgi:hypothetical protein